MQNRITERTKLLNEIGTLASPGYATKMLFDYSRNDIKAAKIRIKEWDYYYVGNSDYAVCLTIADNGYMGLLSATILNFKTKFQKTSSKATLFPMGKMKLPSTSEKGDVEYVGKGILFRFTNDGLVRHLVCKYENFDQDKKLDVDVTLTDFPEESMVIATPFAKDPKAFYFNHKINCMRASGTAKYGSNVYSFDNNNSVGSLDWGRGVWTYKNTWYWGSLSTVLASGETFGFNIGYGFGDTSKASENMLFLNGKAHKLSQVTFNIPTKDGKDDFMSDWTFTSDDGRFEMKFHPLINRNSDTNAYVICSLQNQVFGLFSGKAILDDGKELIIENTLGFAEKVFNKW